ncbi:MAG: hypothetical protein EB830_00690 [Nitrosopumilus sp. H13]|nr:MAG: hypothetical protein EB830_00690 [Nitrosopumilus sp. H13]
MLLKEFEKLGIAATVGIILLLFIPLSAMIGFFDATTLTYEINVIGTPLSMAGAFILVGVYDRLRLERRRRNLKNYWKVQLYRLEQFLSKSMITRDSLLILVQELELSRGYVRESYAKLRYSVYVEQMQNLRKFVEHLPDSKTNATNEAVLLKRTLKKLVDEF